MKIDGWSIDAFGPIQDWTVEDLADHGTVIVLGDNETGKSALFEFLTTTLFGFSPATSDTHPYRPWDGRFPAGSVRARLRDGRDLRISRRLTSRPQGVVEIDGREAEIANRPVEWVGNLGRAVFTNIHALTQNEALRLDARAWQQVEDRVLGGASFDFLHPAREVVDTLDERRLQLWRPDRRGRPRERALRERLRALRQELTPAAERRGQIENIDARLAEIEAKMDAWRDGPDGLQTIEVALDRDVQLTPILRRAQRRQELAAQATKLAPSNEFPVDPRADRDGMRHEITALDDEIGKLNQQVEDAAATQDLSERTRALLTRRGEIEALFGDRSLHVEDGDRLRRMDRELERVSGRLQDMTSRVLERPLDADARNTLLEPAGAELRGRFDAWTAAEHVQAARAEDLRRTERTLARLVADVPEDAAEIDLPALDTRLRDLRDLEREEAIAARGPIAAAGPPHWALALIAAAGLALAVTGLLVNEAIGSALLGVGALAAGGAGLALVRGLVRTPAVEGASPALRSRLGLKAGDDLAEALRGAQAQRDDAVGTHDLLQRIEAARRNEQDARDDLADAQTLADPARAAFFAMLPGVPVAPVHRERPAASFLQDLENARQALGRQAEINEDRVEVARRVATWREQVDAVGAHVSANWPDEPLEAIAVAQRELAEAVRVGDLAQAAMESLPDLREALERAQTARAEVDTRLERLDARLRSLDSTGADAETGLQRLEDSRAALAERERVRLDLDRESPGWPERLREAERLQAEGVAVDLGSEERVKLRARAEEIRAHIEALVDERARLSSERQILVQAAGPAHVQGAIEEAQADLDDTRRAHDRLALLSAAVREAERRYREKHQSPLLAAAGAHLAHITAGRYDLLTVDETGGDGVRLRVRRRGEDFPLVVAHPLSRGTLQQIYLALRLAMVDEVEAGEPLPVFLDEMFVNWDRRRTAGGVEVLRDLGPDRQAFLFTADPDWAERARAQVNARIVETPAREG